MSRKIKINSKEDNNEVLLEKYLISCKVKGQSQATLYDKEIKLNTFISRQNGHIEQKDVDEYILYLMSKGLKNTSINAHLRYISTFCKYINAPVKVSMLKTDDIIKDTYTDKEIQILTNKPNRFSCFTEYRNYVLVNLLVSTGIRIGSTPDIKIDDINMESRTITIRKSKNRISYIVFISNNMYKILLDYIPIIKPYGYLFPTETGNQSSTKSLLLCIRRYNQKRGVELLSCHAFRHTFAQNMLKQGCDIVTLQRLLGHKSMQSTKQYLNMDNSGIHSLYDKYYKDVQNKRIGL